jgi:hypothetical protein
MFLSGVVAVPSRVYWCNVSDPETWTAANWVDFRPSDGDRVTALVPLLQNLIIFKKRTFGQLWTIPPSGSASVTLGPLTQIKQGLGCVGGQAIDVLSDGSVAFLGSDAHVYIYDGSNLTDISDPQPPTPSIQPTLDALGILRLPYSVLRSYPTRKQIWISVSNGSSPTHNLILIYDIVMKSWAKFSNINANAMGIVNDTRTTPNHPYVMLTGNYSGNSYEQDNGFVNPENATTAIDGYGTVSLQLSGDATDFIPRSLMVSYESQTGGSIEVNYGYNDFTNTSKTKSVSMVPSGGALDAFVLGTDVLGGVGYLRKAVILNSQQKTSSIQVQFRNRNGGEDFTIHPFYLSDEVLT